MNCLYWKIWRKKLSLECPWDWLKRLFLMCGVRKYCTLIHEYIHSNSPMGTFVIKLMDIFLLPKPSDQPFHSPASFNVISIAGIHFAYISCCYVGQTSDKLCGHQEQPFVNRVWMKFEYINYKSSLLTYCHGFSMFLYHQFSSKQFIGKWGFVMLCRNAHIGCFVCQIL